MTAKQPLAVVTMVYNEPDMLPLWEHHYHRQVGARHCYILDHGSDDHSTFSVGSNILRLPRDVTDDTQRAAAASNFCAALLFVYDAVLFTDVDELVVADPRIAQTLAEYARQCEHVPCVTVFGMDVLHDDRNEAKLDWCGKILAQRRLVRPMDSLCKPIFIREPRHWGPGFHRYDEQPVFKDLFLFHMAYVDLDVVFERQKKRNASAPVNGLGDHHRLSPDFMLLHIRELTNATPQTVEFGECPVTRAFMEQPVSGLLWLVPERFKGVL